MSKFKIGDRVRISKAGKKEVRDHASNPYDGVGEITGEGLFLEHKVTWDNGEFNTYSSEHLVLASDRTYSDFVCLILERIKAAFA